jgi:hypothetical protein
VIQKQNADAAWLPQGSKRSISQLNSTFFTSTSTHTSIEHIQMAQISYAKVTLVLCPLLLIVTAGQILNTLESGSSVVLRSAKRNRPCSHSRSLVRILRILL